MTLPATPFNEESRLQELRALNLSDTTAEPEFDNLAQLASEICETPVALISFVDQDRLWFKSRVGFNDSQAPREHSFCSHVIEGNTPLIVQDATADPRFKKNQFVLAPQGIRFYAGIPLVLSSGFAVGTLCVIDHKVRALSDRQLKILNRLALQAVALIEARRSHLSLLAQEQKSTFREQRHDFALNSADIGEWERDVSTTVTRRSLKHDQIFGYPEAVQDWNYSIFLSHIVEDDRARVDANYQRAIAGKGVYDVEYRIIWPDASLHWLWTRGRFYFDDAGNLYKAAGIVVDITERKRSEENLRESEYRWRFAIEGSGDGLWDWDIPNNQVFYSDRWKVILGLENDDIGNSPMVWASHLYPEDKDRVLLEVQTHLDGQIPHYTSEHRVVCKDGSVKWVLGRGLVVQRDANGKPLRMIGTNTDISERKWAESALLASNSQLQLLETCIARLNDIVLITEAEPVELPGPRIIFVNDAFVRRTGFTREEVIGKTPRILQGPKTQREVLDRIGTSLKRWEPVRAELINYTKAGQEFWLELEIVPVANSAGWFTHWVAVERDITQRKSSESKLLESEMRHRSMFENNPQPMWVFDTQTLAFLSVNDAAIDHYGYSREEFSQMTIRDIEPAEDLSKLDARLSKEIRRPSSKAELWTHQRKDGKKIQVEMNSHAIDFQGRSAGLSLVNDVTEQLKSQARVQYLAYHDTLTGLPNRTQFLDLANEVLQENKSSSSLSAVILFDLDNFKRINDHWGHRVGDELLKQVALRVQQCLPPTAFLARLGGDEFIVLIADAGPDQAATSVAAQDLCSKIIVALAQRFLIDKREHHTSASLGIALLGETEIKVDELLSRADSAMYSAKAEGRNTFRFFDGQLQAQLAAQSELEAELRQSIQNNELHLVYQPQVDQLGRIVGSEALLRWTHPRRGLVSPAHFIPVAESSGFILQVGQWVLNTACKTLAQWQLRSHTANLPLAVNVSARQFHHPDFVSQVLSELEMSGANPELLKLELTESLLAQDLDGIVKKMNTLKAKGVTFSLDDFGTGYSSLAYLKRLPLDQLKIDQGFVRDILSDASDAAIVRTVIALGDTLGLNVIAEGVETEAQREFLATNGCNSYQGYLFSRPLEMEEFETFCGYVGP